MDTKAAIKQLFDVVSTQQKVITRLAQMQGAMPAQAPGEDLSAKLQAALFGANPGLQAAFVEPPTVAHSDGGKSVVFYKYHMGKDSNAIKALVVQAADSVLGQGAYTVQSIGQ